MADESAMRVWRAGLERVAELERGLSFDLVEGAKGARAPHDLRGHLTHIEGDREGVAVAVVQSTYGITVEDVYLWQHDRWRLWLHFWGDSQRRFRGAHTGPPRRALVMVIDFDKGWYGFETAGSGGADARPMPRAADESGGGCEMAVTPSTFVVLAGGEVVVAGKRCGHSTAIVEIWDADAKKSRLVPEPTDLALDVRALLAPSANEIYVGGCTKAQPPQPYLGRLNGDRWEVIDAPPVSACIDGMVTTHGALWVIAREPEPPRPLAEPRARLWRKTKTWEQVDLPTPWGGDYTVNEVSSSGGAEAGKEVDVWVSIADYSEDPATHGGQAVLRTGP